MNMTIRLRRVSTPDRPDGEQHGAQRQIPGDAAPGSRHVPLPAHDHGADDGDEEQQRGELEGQQVDREQALGRAARCRRSPACTGTGAPERRAHARRAGRASTARRRPSAATNDQGRRRRGPLLHLQVEQHDHEQEQHDDGAGVDDDLQYRTICASRPRKSTASRNSVPTSPSALYTGLRCSDHHQRRRHRERRQDQEQDDAHAIPRKQHSAADQRRCSPAPRGSNPFQPSRMSWS